MLLPLSSRIYAMYSSPNERQESQIITNRLTHTCPSVRNSRCQSPCLPVCASLAHHPAHLNNDLPSNQTISNQTISLPKPSVTTIPCLSFPLLLLLFDTISQQKTRHKTQVPHSIHEDIAPHQCSILIPRFSFRLTYKYKKRIETYSPTHRPLHPSPTSPPPRIRVPSPKDDVDTCASPTSLSEPKQRNMPSNAHHLY